ncbi:Uncharacterized protein FWK35_00013970 [Aphis craccivora]|uniref:Uncharacterized protein n=1 Tax=Aphis craccivora TaxID=307492 RepID=A0A6G0YF09_APHCR|nr:Uncharacterized protein FWK35_00013970 [Aphis craccivora]
MNLLKSLKEQSEVRNVSIDDLVVDVSYTIKTMKRFETAFGMAISRTLEDPVMGDTINVFLPKSSIIRNVSIEDLREKNEDSLWDGATQLQCTLAGPVMEGTVIVFLPKTLQDLLDTLILSDPN